MPGILIVDDEKNIRAGIHKILSESLDLDIQFYEAKNGLEALEIIREKNPDLLITDIRMPKMDGIELMQKVSFLETRPELIVLSGYDEFSYAKEAIKRGVISYILKPVDRNELISVVSGAVSRIERKRRDAVELAIQRVMSEGRMTPESTSAGLFKAPCYFILFSGKTNSEMLNALIKETSGYILEKKNDSICLLVDESFKKKLEESRAGQSFCAGMSARCSSLANLRVAWRQSSLALFSRFFEPDKKLYLYREPEKPFDRSALDSLSQKVSALVYSGDSGAVTGSLNDLFVFDNLTPEEKPRYLFSLHDFVISGIIRKYWEYSDTDMYLSLKGLMLENIHQFKTLEEYKHAVFDYVVYLNLVLLKQHTESPFIADALEYIKVHFAEDINMTVVANTVSVNYTYFSEKFKEHTGLNFNGYIKNLRIEEAKRLLGKGCYKVYEVATLSGFGDVKYFMKTFKESTGFSPGEFMKKF
jgi:two-component system response regulator YesN